MRAPVRGNIRGDLDHDDQQPMPESGGRAGRATLGAIADRPEIVALVRRLMTEADAAANALGVVLPQPMEKPCHCRQIDARAGPTLGIAVQQSSGVS